MDYTRIDPQIAGLEIQEKSLPALYGHPGVKAHFLEPVELVQTIPIYHLNRATSIDNLHEITQLVEERILNDY